MDAGVLSSENGSVVSIELGDALVGVGGLITVSISSIFSVN